MPPEIILATAALALLEKIMPIIHAKIQSGEITDAQQTDVAEKYKAFRARTDLFSGPEWQPETPQP